MPLSLKCDHPVIWAHRGGRSLDAENTLAAVRKGHAAGAHGWETDVVLTKDGVPILLHDLNLLRCTNAVCHASVMRNSPALPWRFTLEEIKQLNAGIFPQRKCPSNARMNVCNKFPLSPASENSQVPTLAEALRLSRELGLWVNIEIKDVSKAMPQELADSIVSKVHEVVAAESMQEEVLISSFNHNYIVESKQVAPKIPTGALTPHAFTGDPVVMANAVQADAWHPGHKRLTKEAVVAARNAGLAVNPYTVNDPDRMQRLVEWGVTGLVTDCPQHAKKLFP